jgi:oligopeptidase A
MARRLRMVHSHLAATAHCRQCSAVAAVDASNPLLRHREMPAFRAITPDHVEPAVTALLAQQETDIEALETSVAALGDAVTYDDVFRPLEELLHPLSYAFGLVGHLMAVANSEELRAAHASVLPAVVASGSRIAQSEPLFRAMKAVADSDEALDSGQERAVEAALRDAELGGVALEGAAKERFNEIKQRLAELSTTFSNNVLDATSAWSLTITDPAELDGLPPSALALAAQSAGEGATAEAGPYKLTLDMPMLMPVMTFANSRSLRETVYKANLTKASELSGDGEHNNMPLIEEILQLRAEMAGLLGYGAKNATLCAVYI